MNLSSLGHYLFDCSAPMLVSNVLRSFDLRYLCFFRLFVRSLVIGTCGCGLPVCWNFGSSISQVESLLIFVVCIRQTLLPVFLVPISSASIPLFCLFLRRKFAQEFILGRTETTCQLWPIVLSHLLFTLTTHGIWNDLLFLPLPNAMLHLFDFFFV